MRGGGGKQPANNRLSCSAMPKARRWTPYASQTCDNQTKDQKVNCPCKSRKHITLILLTWNIGWAPNNASKWQMGFNSAFKGLKADSHIACRAAKGLECVFPIWFTQCSRVWFTLAMPRPCHALTMPFFSRPRHSTAVGFFRLPCEVPRRLLPEAYQSSSQRSIPATVKSGTQYKKDNLLNCWTSSSDISGYHAHFREGHGTVGTGQGRGMVCVN